MAPCYRSPLFIPLERSGSIDREHESEMGKQNNCIGLKLRSKSVRQSVSQAGSQPASQAVSQSVSNKYEINTFTAKRLLKSCIPVKLIEKTGRQIANRYYGLNTSPKNTVA